jgi:GMP synthase (glutamine-hydrolysing)
MTERIFFILEHEESEGPGIFGSLLRAEGLSFERIKLFRGEALPFQKQAAGVLIMGGPMNVYEETAWPFLRDEDRFLRQCLSDSVPLLGICLGAQLIAKAAGARVMKAAVREVGWYPVQLTAAGRNDPLLAGLPESFSIFQFHEDTFGIPAGAVRTFTGEHCPNQGFSINRRAHGLQFHVEATQDMIAEWTGDEGELRIKILQDTQEHIARCHRYGNSIFLKFLSLCNY